MLTLKCPNCGHVRRPYENPGPACGKSTSQAVNDLRNSFFMAIVAIGILVLLVLWMIFG